MNNQLHIKTVPTDKPCSECGSSPSLQWHLHGMSGILCMNCFKREVDSTNVALQSDQSTEALVSQNLQQTTILHMPSLKVKIEDDELTFMLPDCEVELSKMYGLVLGR